MTKQEIISNIEKVNDYWISQNEDEGDCAWERGCYFIGNMDAYRVTGKKEYLDYAVSWANKNNWSFYDDKDNNTTNADNLICGETYLDLIDEFSVAGTDKNMLKTLEWTVNDPNNDYWWWVDTIYMALNFYNRIGLRQKDERFFEKAYKLYYNSKVERKCFDEEYALWFRDERFLPEVERNTEGKKMFWSRGNGWIFAGLAKTLETIDENHPYYNEYLTMFKRMAESIKKLQLSDGFWHTDLLSPYAFDMPETSGTLLFALGFLKGYNCGILDEEAKNAAFSALEAVNKYAMDENGRIGWVQVVAWGPGPVKEESVNDYAVGTYLKACKEAIIALDK